MQNKYKNNTPGFPDPFLNEKKNNSSWGNCFNIWLELQGWAKLVFSKPVLNILKMGFKILKRLKTFFFYFKTAKKYIYIYIFLNTFFCFEIPKRIFTSKRFVSVFKFKTMFPVSKPKQFFRFQVQSDISVFKVKMILPFSSSKRCFRFQSQSTGIWGYMFCRF